jgi:hypothetical protein
LELIHIARSVPVWLKTNNHLIKIISDTITEEPAMEIEASKTTPILNIAWTRYAHLDSASVRRSRANSRLRFWIILLGVLATLFAILTQIFFSGPDAEDSVSGLIVKILFVTTPILASILAAFTAKFYANGNWLLLRSAAEEIKKEIYIFRTILQKNAGRRAQLEKRLAQIQRGLFRSLAADFSFEDYQGSIPPHHNPDDPNSDPGFNDLSGDEYYRYRLQNQLNWHNKKINTYKYERRSMTIFVLAAGGLGSVFAAWGGGLSLWVALTAAITAALIGWQELRRVDATIRNYSRVVVELTILSDHWLNLEQEERSPVEFYKMVRSTEEILWSQNVQYTKFMQEALQESDLDEEASLINRVINESLNSAERTKKAMADEIADFTKETLEEDEQIIEETLSSTLGSLAEEASSELVQQELAAMGEAVTGTAENVVEKVSAASSSLADSIKEIVHGDIGRDTPKEELNTILASLPKTNDVKG